MKNFGQIMKKVLNGRQRSSAICQNRFLSPMGSWALRAHRHGDVTLTGPGTAWLYVRPPAGSLAAEFRATRSVNLVSLSTRQRGVFRVRVPHTPLAGVPLSRVKSCDDDA
jgi:hypothetical protein